jgi:hypothetical protein
MGDSATYFVAGESGKEHVLAEPLVAQPPRLAFQTLRFPLTFKFLISKSTMP